MTVDSTSQAFFDEMYKRDPDPWNFSSSEYERHRYETIISQLSGHRYKRAYEPGCSIGILTSRLAKFCDELVAMDISPAAVSLARERCRELPNVDIRQGMLPFDIPTGNFDLIIFSEVGYYFEELQLARLGNLLMNQLDSAGVLIAVHWLGRSKDHCTDGR